MVEKTGKTQDGVHAPVPRKAMAEDVRRYRDAYERVPGAPLFRTEFGYYCLDEWHKQGLDPKADKAEVFNYHRSAHHSLGQLGWCEAQFVPAFEERIVEDRGDCEVFRDYAGRHLLCFKGRRSGFMPEYIDHPVKDWKTWEKDVKWRMNPATPERYADLGKRMAAARKAAAEGKIMTQGIIGGYMYLRSLIGPEGLLYMFYDSPGLIHDCMKTWLELADAVTSRHQEHVMIEEIFFAEDICYNHGPLISPDMMKEFLIPYYQQLIANIRWRQIDKSRHIYVQVDTDGFANPTIPIYKEAIGMDVMSPFEVASGCDVVEIGKQYPDLVMRGGIDKRVLAKTKQDIDRMVERILPAMRERGGYIPCCDHGVPAEVPLDNYLHYRRRCVELGG